ncbi:MAG: GHMP kinase [Elusimicrobia bacterium]|nr:GHMP kinase [Elusimicrobiota bacterium]
MIISKTPLRISFAGGGTDLPSFYKSNGYGAVLSTSINSYIYVTVKKHTALFNERIRLNYSESELLDARDKVKNPIIRECLKFLAIDERIYISTIADAPGQSGLGSSSSFCVGLLNALYKFKHMSVSVGRIADEAAHIEIDVLKRPMGKQDHYAAAFGGLNYLRFHADGTVTVKPVIIPMKRHNLLFNSMLSFWTGVSRPSESILAEQDRNNPRNSGLLLAMRQQAEDLCGLLYREDFSMDRFGRIIHDGWEMKRKLASQITNSSIDRCYELAMGNGAYGGKISGAGGGGFLNVFAAPERLPVISKELEREGLVPFQFDIDASGATVTELD